MSENPNSFDARGTLEAGGKKHTIYIHPEYPNLRASVGRHNNLATGYAETAINLIDQLKKLQAAREDESDAN